MVKSSTLCPAGSVAYSDITRPSAPPTAAAFTDAAASAGAAGGAREQDLAAAGVVGLCRRIVDPAR
jgi:hypothetical protein